MARHTGACSFREESEWRSLFIVSVSKLSLNETLTLAQCYTCLCERFKKILEVGLDRFEENRNGFCIFNFGLSFDFDLDIDGLLRWEVGIVKLVNQPQRSFVLGHG